MHCVLTKHGRRPSEGMDLVDPLDADGFFAEADGAVFAEGFA